MNRRDFVETLGGTGMLAGLESAAAAERKRTRFYLLEQYFMKNGTQPGRLQEFFSQGRLPAWNKVHAGPKLFLEALVAPHMPQAAVITGFETLGELPAMAGKVDADPQYVKALTDWEAGAEQPYEQLSTTLLAAAEYSPEITVPAEPPKSPRIFEMRVYHSPTWRQLKALHERFAGPEIRIFHRVGVHPILYSSTAIGANLPNLTYVIPFESLAAREKAWAAFSADPEWAKVRKESIDRHGQISSVMQISIYRASAYSPVR